jgi:hypothetical protein
MRYALGSAQYNQVPFMIFSSLRGWRPDLPNGVDMGFIFIAATAVGVSAYEYLFHTRISQPVSAAACCSKLT